jgi:hypothetical protein
MVCVVCKNERKIYAGGACISCYTKLKKRKLTVPQLQALMEITHCQVCQRPVDQTVRQGKRGSNKGKACIDHDHETDLVRGILCPNCNLIEGYLNKLDDPEKWITNLVDYLNNPPLEADQIYVPKLKKLRNKEL